MLGLAAFAAFLGGLGLFLTGVGTLSSAVRRLVGPGLRALVARGVAGRARGAAAGVAAGLLTQSTMAVTAAAGGLVTGGSIGLRASLPLLSWANVGTTGIALLATLDIRPTALVLLGLGAVLPFFRLDLSGRLTPALSVVLALGMQLLGASLMKAGLEPLPGSDVVAAVLAGPFGAVAPLLLGAAVAFVAASSSASNVLAAALGLAGILGLPGAAVVMYGGLAGSGLSLLVAWGGAGADLRRAALYQAAWKILGGGFLVLLLLAETAGLPGLLSLCRAVSDSVAGQVATLIVLCQVVVALAALPLDRVAETWLRRRVPDPPETDLARPRFLSDAALSDPGTALDMAGREAERLLARLPLSLDAAREEAAPPPAGLSDATARLEQAIQAYLARLGDASPDVLDRSARLRDRVATATALREAAEEVARAAAGATGPAAPLLAALVESLHALLHDAGDPDPDLLEDRTEAMDALRRRAASAGLEAEGYGRLFRATDAFARAIWLMRRLVARRAAV